MKKRLILKASAGTGKTYRLSLEYVAALCRGTDFKDILVMTFTKKATAEIKERILSFFSQLAVEEKNELEENILKLYPDIKFDRKKIGETYNELVQNKDKLKIYTIDAFTNQIFKRAIAPYLKLYSYEIIDDEENKNVLIKTFQKIFENKEDFRAFKGFLEDNSEKNMERYLKLIKELLDERWKIILLGDKIKEKRERYQVNSNYQYFEQITEVLKRVSEIKKKSLEDLFKTDLKGYLNVTDVEEKEKFILDTYETTLKGEVWNKNKVQSSKKENIDNELRDLDYIYKELKTNLTRTMFNNFIIPYEEKLLYIINRIYRVYDDIKFREKRLTHSDISNYTFEYIRDKELNFIDENGVTEEFFEILDGRIDTIFIDEFQDTSILQWKILKDIIDQTDNVICVGDEKQSIYGWRGGEKKLFENLEAILDGTAENLETCFRSEQNVVDFYNIVFENISNAMESQENKWHFNRAASKNDNHLGHIELLKDESEDLAIDSIIEKIENDFKGVYKGIGILARKNSTLEDIGRKLTEAGIPFVTASDSNISNSRGMKGVFFLINWLVKNDYLALLDFLRSDLINISAETVKYLIKSRESVESWLNNENISLSLGAEDIEILKEVREIKNLYIENNGETSFLTYDILKKTGIISRFNSKGDISNLYSFYKIVKSYKYFEEFLVEFEDQENNKKFKKMTLEDENSVSLMTIHKSKGLEFDTLFYYYKASNKNNRDSKMRFFITMDNNYEETKDFFLTHDKFKKIFNALEDEYNYFNEMELKEKQEEINNLYVALTRPKNNLYLSYVVPAAKEDSVTETPKKKKSSEKKGENKSSANFIIDIFSSFDEKLPQGDIVSTEIKPKESKKQREVFQLDMSTPEAQYPDADESMGQDLEKIYSHSLSNEVKRVRGSAVHFFLENIIHGTDEEVAAARELTFSKFASSIGEGAIKELLSPAVIEYLLNKNSEIFSEKWDKIYTEYEIYNGDKTYRIDRLMIKEAVIKDKEVIEKGIIFIADYKTGETDEDQIENYKNIISSFLRESGRENQYDVVTEFIEYTL